MSNLRRIVSSVLILAMIAASGVFTLEVFAEAESNANDPMVSDVTLNDEDTVIAEKLTTFGIIDAVGDEDLVKYLTRADMIGILMKYLKLDGTTTSADTTPFLDVSVFDPQIGAYSMLFKAGYIAGDDNKMYRPNDLLTYNEAVTLIVNAMGYKMFAVRNGGYPEGYLYTANKYGLLSGLRGNGQNPIPYCDLYRIMEGSLDADAVVQRYFGADGEGEFELQKDVSVLEEIYGIKEIKGVVTGNENTRLLSSNSQLIDMNQIEIENVIYDTPDLVYADYLGRRVIAYAEENDQKEYEIIYMELDGNKNREFEVQADDLLIDETTSSRIYYEDENFKEKHINVDAANLSVIYNGKSRTGYGQLKNTLPKSGYIVGVDNTGDDAVDVLFVYEFKNIVVGTIDLYNYKFYDKYTNEATIIDPDKDDVRIYNAGGKSMRVSDILADDILTIMETDNDKGYKLITVYDERKSLEGTVEEITSENKYLIDGEYYELAYNLDSYIENGELPPLKAGTTATFYLDREGKLANYERGTATTAIYGFVAGVDTKGSISSRLTLKIFTQDATWVTAETVDKVNVDGERYSVGTDEGRKQAIAAIPVGEVVLFTMSGDKINYIDTARINRGNPSKYSDTGNLNEIAAGSEFEHRNGMCNEKGDGSLNKFVVKSGNCIIFSTPATGELLDNLEDYSVTTSLAKNYYAVGSGQYNQVVTDGYFVYNTGEDDINVASCILLRGSKSAGASSLGKSSAFVVVTKISSAINDEGEMRTKLYYDQNGSELSNLLKDDDKVDYSYDRAGNAQPTQSKFSDIGLEVGDVIQLATDEKGYITAINVAYRINQESALKENAWLKGQQYSLSFGNYNGEGAACGIVKKVNATDKILQFSVTTETDGVEKVYNIGTGSAGVSIYRQDLEKAESANLAALMEGDLVLIRSSTGFAASAAQILVIR